MYTNRTFEHNYEDYEFSESDCIGKGGFAVVYEGIRRKDNKPVAIKKITKNQKLGKKELAIMETLAADPESKKYLVRLEGYFYHRNHLHLVMPYYELGCLRNFMRRNQRFSEETIAGILKKLVRAVIYLHSKGFVHRDLTLGNILVTSVVGNKVNVLVSDLGLTKQMEGEQLQTIVGTPGYMHPGIRNGNGYGKEVDVYSLGGILYALFTGNDPKNGRDEMLKEARKLASSDAVDLLGKMLDTRRPIRLTDISLHQFMKEHAVSSNNSTIMESNLSKKFPSKKSCLHRTVEDGKCVLCLKTVRKSDVQRKLLAKDSGLASDDVQQRLSNLKVEKNMPVLKRVRSDQTLARGRGVDEEDVSSWPLEKYDHMAPVVMPCQNGKFGRMILKGKKLIFEHVDGQYVDYVFEIQQSIRTSGLIHQTMSVFKPVSQRCVIPTDEKQKNPVQYDDRAMDTFTTSRMPSEMAKCYRLIQRSLGILKGRVARVDFVNIFGVKRLNAKLMYNGDFRLIFPNDKIFKRSPGNKEIIDVKKMGRMNAEEADIFEKADRALQKQEEAFVYSHGEDHPPLKIQVPPSNSAVDEEVITRTDQYETGKYISSRKPESLPDFKKNERRRLR